jgi:hypothetical protein
MRFSNVTIPQPSVVVVRSGVLLSSMGAAVTSAMPKIPATRVEIRMVSVYRVAILREELIGVIRLEKEWEVKRLAREREVNVCAVRFYSRQALLEPKAVRVTNPLSLPLAHHTICEADC